MLCGIEHAYRFGSPEIFAPVSYLGLDGLAGKRAFDEHNPTINARHGCPAVGQLANGQLHLGKPLPQQFVDPGRICLAPRKLHNLSDQKHQRLLLSSLEVSG